VLLFFDAPLSLTLKDVLTVMIVMVIHVDEPGDRSSGDS